MRVFCYLRVERSLLNNEWNERHKTCALDCFGNLALVATTDSCVATGLHTTVRVDEKLQHLGVLIVDEFNLVLGEITLHINLARSIGY